MDSDRPPRAAPPSETRTPDGGDPIEPPRGGDRDASSNTSEYHDSVPTTPVLDEEAGTYSARYDWSDVTPSTAIIEAVSTVADADPVELDPLHRVVDPDAIDELLDPAGNAEGGVEVTFRYESVHVSARRDGRITLRPEGNEAPE